MGEANPTSLLGINAIFFSFVKQRKGGFPMQMHAPPPVPKLPLLSQPVLGKSGLLTCRPVVFLTGPSS